MKRWRASAAGTRAIALGFAGAALVLCMATRTHAQARWGLGRWQGDGIFFLDWEKQDDKRSQSKYETILFQERLRLRNLGAFLVDPRFFRFNLGGSFGLSQEEGIAASDNPLRVGNGTLYDYAFDGVFLGDRPYPVTVFANRSESILTQGFGGRADVRFESRGGTFELREGSFLERRGIRHFTSVLDVRQELLNEDSSVFGSPFLRDETRNVVRYGAHKGGESSDMDLRYELDDVSDPINLADNFQSHTVRAVHSLDFGARLNRRLDSVLYYFTRSGVGPSSYLSFDEGLRIDHSANLASNLRYDFSRSDSSVGVTTTNSGSASVRHQLYGHLTTTIDGRGLRQDFPNGAKTIYGGQAGAAYRRSLPGQGELSAQTYVGYQVDDNAFTSSRVDVVDEPHAAPPLLGAGAGFTLANPFVMSDTVVVVDVRGGARLPTVLNLDYILTQEGSLTRVVPLAGSPVIRPDDPLEVSYAYSVDPGLEYSTATLSARTGIDYRWFGLSYQHVLSDQTRLSGAATPQFLIDQNVDDFSLELRHQWNAVRGQSTVAYEIFNSTIVDSRSWRFSQLLSYQPRFDLNAQLSGDQDLIDYPNENRRSESYLVRATVDWLTPIGPSLAPFAGYRSYRDTGTQRDEILDFGVRLRWTFRNLEISQSFSWADYRRRLNDVRAQLQITRRFF